MKNLPDKGEKIRIKNKEIKEEIKRRNITVNGKDNESDKMEVKEENENKKEKADKNEHNQDMEILNEQMQTIKISEKENKENVDINTNDNTTTNNNNTKIKHGQAKVADKILNNAILSNQVSMIPHKPNKSHSKIISIQESLEIQIKQRKIAKEKEIADAIKKLEKSKMSTGPINVHSTKYRDHMDEYSNYSNSDDDTENDYDDNDDDDDEESSDDEADKYLFRSHKI